MNEINKDKLLKIIQEVKEENNYQGKNFEIFVLNKMINLPYLKKEFEMDLYRTRDPLKGFILEHKRSNLSFYFDAEKKEIVSEMNYNTNGDKLNNQTQMNILRNIVKLLEESETHIDFNNNYEKYINIENKEELKEFFNLMDKFDVLNFFIEYRCLNDINESEINKFNFLDEVENALPFNYKDIESSIMLELKKDALNNNINLNKREFSELKKIERFYNQTDDEDEFTINKRMTLFNNDFFKENTVTGVIMDKDIEIKDSLLKIFGMKYNEIRKNIISELENYSYLKSKEEIESKMPISKAIEAIIKEYPFLKNEIINDVNITIEKSKFTKIESEANIHTLNNNKSLNKLGLIDDHTYKNLNDNNIYNTPFFENHPDKCEKVIFKFENELDTVIQYIYKEKDCYGIKVLSPKLAYIKPQTSDEVFKESLKVFCDYAYANKCVIHYGEYVDMDIMLYSFQQYLDENYKDKIIYLDDGYNSNKNLSYILSLKKEFGDKISYEDLYDFHKKQMNHVNIEEIYSETVDELKIKYKIKNKKNEPN